MNRNQPIYQHYIQAIESRLNIGRPELNKIVSFKPFGQSSFHETYQVKTSDKTYFLKYQSSPLLPNILSTEAKGLRLISNFKTIRTPDVVAQFNQKGQYLLLEFIEVSKPNQTFWIQFAKQLTKLHQQTDKLFGAKANNYIGRLKQSNKQHKNWIDFFVTERIQPQLKIAIDSATIEHSIVLEFEKLFKRLADFLPVEKPSLLHGDLWSGNFLCNQKNQAVLIDPAAYYGHREMDIAMSLLFGGFQNHFYTTYQNAFPMEKGWEERMEIYQLYPLLVHVNLFGESYTRQVEKILTKFS